MHIYIQENCETFGKKSTSRLCENPLVKSYQKYIHSYSTRCTEHIIQPDPDHFNIFVTNKDTDPKI